MRSNALLMLMAALALGSGTAYAQPVPVAPATFYVCTADAQVVRFSGGDAAVIARGDGSFDDCVIGPDGGLYIANGIQVVRFYPRLGGYVVPDYITEIVASGLPSPARGLSFNVRTLYINTQSSGVYQSIGSIDISTPHLSFDPAAAASLFGVTPAGGHGLTFDVEGNMVVASGGSILRSTTPQYVSQYGAPVNLGVNGGVPFGLALNTCQNVLFTDRSSQRLKLLVKSTKIVDEKVVEEFSVQNTNVAFSRRTLPLNLEVDSSNRAYVLLADDELGTNAQIVLAEPTGATTDPTGAAWITTCTNLTVSPLLDLKSRLSGRNAIAGLLSARAVGLAVEPTAHRISHTFPAGGSCGLGTELNFGYHSATFYYKTCPGLTIQVTAHKSQPSEVRFGAPGFSTTTHPNIHAIPYSALGGFATEYVLTSSAAITPRPDRIKYAFFTQDSIARPGLARSANEAIGDPDHGTYDEDIAQQDFWDVGVLDGAGGERENDFSKRVLYNSGLDPARHCTFANLFDEPLDVQKPLFNGPQNIKISIRVTGTNCAGGTVRVSIVRVFMNDDGTEWYVPQTVTSNSQNDNLMDSLNGKYTFNLDALALDTTGATKSSPARFLITLSGDVAPLKNQPFYVSK